MERIRATIQKEFVLIRYVIIQPDFQVEIEETDPISSVRVSRTESNLNVVRETRTTE